METMAFLSILSKGIIHKGWPFPSRPRCPRIPGRCLDKVLVHCHQAALNLTSHFQMRFWTYSYSRSSGFGNISLSRSAQVTWQQITRVELKCEWCRVGANLERCRTSCSPYSPHSCKYFKLSANETGNPKIIITANIFTFSPNVLYRAQYSGSLFLSEYVLARDKYSSSVLPPGSSLASLYWPCICYHHQHQSFSLSHTDQWCTWPVYNGNHHQRRSFFKISLVWSFFPPDIQIFIVKQIMN